MHPEHRPPRDPQPSLTAPTTTAAPRLFRRGLLPLLAAGAVLAGAMTAAGCSAGYSPREEGEFDRTRSRAAVESTAPIRSPGTPPR